MMKFRYKHLAMEHYAKTEPVEGEPTEQMWRTIRMMRNFTSVDLVAHASIPITPETAATYCMMLVRSGYLRMVRIATAARPAAEFKLIRDTGPRPPIEKRVRAVWDPNIDEFTHVGGRPTNLKGRR